MKTYLITIVEEGVKRQVTREAASFEEAFFWVKMISPSCEILALKDE